MKKRSHELITCDSWKTAAVHPYNQTIAAEHASDTHSSKHTHPHSNKGVSTGQDAHLKAYVAFKLP